MGIFHARIAFTFLAGAAVAACSGTHGTQAASSSGTSSTGASSSAGGAGGSTGSAGMAVTPGNGCAAALGVDAGFYTCSRQYFVSPSGSDANGGTSPAEALATLGAATKLPLQGGDCVTVEAGTYNETVTLSTSGSADTCTGYVVFRSASQGAAKIVSADPYQAVSVGASYVMMDGFDIQDTSTGSAFNAGSNDVVGGHVVVYHHIAAIRNVAHDSGGAGLSAIHADYIRFEGNTVYKNSATSPYGDSGIDLWEAQASDTKPGFHIVVRNNVSYQNAEWNIPSPTDGEGIILDSFDYADATYGTTPYHQQSLVENNVCWGNGGRGIEVAGAGPTSYVTVRNNTVFDDNRQQLPWPGAEIVSIGNHNEFYDNIAILGFDAKDGPNGAGLTVVLQDGCGTQGGVEVTTGSVWEGNIAFSMLTGDRLSESSCPAPVSATANKLGVNPGLAAPAPSATTAQAFAIGASSPAAHAGTGASYAPFDFAYTKRPDPPSIGAFEP
jgi:Right handed beta helix region